MINGKTVYMHKKDAYVNVMPYRFYQSLYPQLWGWMIYTDEAEFFNAVLQLFGPLSPTIAAWA